MAAETGLWSVQRFRVNASSRILAVHGRHASSGPGVEKNVVFLMNRSLQLRVTSAYLRILG